MNRAPSLLQTEGSGACSSLIIPYRLECWTNSRYICLLANYSETLQIATKPTHEKSFQPPPFTANPSKNTLYKPHYKALHESIYKSAKSSTEEFTKMYLPLKNTQITFTAFIIRCKMGFMKREGSWLRVFWRQLSRVAGKKCRYLCNNYVKYDVSVFRQTAEIEKSRFNGIPLH